MTTVVVNGVKREVQAPSDTPLLYVLRNDLELSGPTLIAPLLMSTANGDQHGATRGITLR